MRVHVWVCAALALCATRSAAQRARHEAELLYRETEDAGAGAGDERVVLVSDDAYRAYRARPESRLDADPGAYRARPQPARARQPEPPRQPPVQTLRNYNKVNDDGSFTFGYEAADGSFKEETRGTDCVVRGKYGYVDPDGNKREFTYVSGNPCDPNRPDEDGEADAPESAEIDDEGPANYPAAPARARFPATTRAPAFLQGDLREDEEDEPLQQVRPRVTQRPRPAPAHLAITPRPQPAATPRALPQPPPTTFRPQLLAAPAPSSTAAPRLPYSPAPQYAPQPQYVSTARPAHIDFAAEFAKFQREHQPQVASGAPAPQPRPAAPPLYQTELVLDPASGQYDTQLFQTLPQTKGELNLNQRLQPFVAQPAPRPFLPSQPAPALYRPASGQDAYQRQQSSAQFASSAQLFQQQQQLQQSQLQRDRAAARAQAQRLASPPPFYSPAPSSHIDTFLRDHGIQF